MTSHRQWNRLFSRDCFSPSRKFIVLTFPISSIHTSASPWSPAPLVGSCVTPLCLFSHFPEEYGPSIATVWIKLVQAQKVLKQLLEPRRFQTTVNRCLSSVPRAALLFSVAHTSDPYTADLSPLWVWTLLSGLCKGMNFAC